VRIPDSDWKPALSIAEQRGDDLSSILRSALERYVKRNLTPEDEVLLAQARAQGAVPAQPAAQRDHSLAAQNASDR
jgi:hypothetical protein